MSLTDENNTEFSNVSKYNYNRVCNTVSKVGYSDGITDGRESVFQKGFDSGYENGLLTGFELSKYKAFFGVMSKHGASDDIQKESLAYDELSIPEAKDKSHFKMLELLDKSTTEVSQKQVNYVNQQKDTFAGALPIVTNLFSQ